MDLRSQGIWISAKRYKQAKATQTALEQAEVLCDSWAAD